VKLVPYFYNMWANLLVRVLLDSNLEGEMRLYRIRNKADNGVWVFAETEARALELALASGHARKMENLRVIGDQTDIFADRHDTSRVQVEGIACVLFINNQSKGTWSIYDPIKKKIVRDEEKGVGM
jgi:hypothetical protein